MSFPFITTPPLPPPVFYLQASVAGGYPSARETQTHRGRLHGLLDAVGLAPRSTVEEHHPVRQQCILPGSAATIHKLQDQWMSHKHTSDPLRMSLSIRPIRIGHSQGFALSLQRCEPEQLLMVTGECEASTVWGGLNGMGNGDRE